MFTGIIEELAEVVAVTPKGGNVDLTVKSNLTKELKIDQSVAHNGVCLTVVEIEGDTYTVTAIEETLNRTNIGQLKSGDFINLERCTQIGARLDGHIVQGHVDTTATCTEVINKDGSWIFSFEYPSNPEQRRKLLAQKKLEDDKPFTKIANNLGKKELKPFKKIPKKTTPIDIPLPDINYNLYMQSKEELFKPDPYLDELKKKVDLAQEQSYQEKVKNNTSGLRSFAPLEVKRDYNE